MMTEQEIKTIQVRIECIQGEMQGFPVWRATLGYVAILIAHIESQRAALHIAQAALAQFSDKENWSTGTGKYGTHYTTWEGSDPVDLAERALVGSSQ